MAEPERAMLSTTNQASQLTEWLRAHSLGDRAALGRVISCVYDDILGVAQRVRRRHHAATSTNSLAHVALEKLMRQAPPNWENRNHFFATLTCVLRAAVVDSNRRRLAARHGSGQAPEALNDAMLARYDERETISMVREALFRMQQFHKRMAQVVECRALVGLSEEETAAKMNLPLRTVQRDWQRGRAWLRLELER